jgi:hypothetical protein
MKAAEAARAAAVDIAALRAEWDAVAAQFAALGPSPDPEVAQPLADRLHSLIVQIRSLTPPMTPNEIEALRARVAAIVAEFDKPLPKGDAGIIEADRRSKMMEARWRELSQEFRHVITMAVEEAEIIAHREPVIDRIHAAIRNARPKTLAGAAVVLRHLIDEGLIVDPGSNAAEAVAALIERQGAGEAAP